MTRINLLPWRELLRKEREREFFTMAGGAAFFMALVIVYIHFHMNGVIETQNGRNAFLNEEIKKVEAQIKEIQSLETEKSQLLARMKVIEELQGQRPQMVHLFDEVAKTLPDGVYLTSIKQTGTDIVIEGVAQSNARVSAFMRNIDSSHWLAEPRLNVIEALSSKDGAQKGSKFILNIKQVMEGEPLPSETSAAGAPKTAAPKAAPKAAPPKKVAPKADKAGKPS
jgi:type IV pilus assembly protein PilN